MLTIIESHASNSELRARSSRSFQSIAIPFLVLLLDNISDAYAGHSAFFVACDTQTLPTLARSGRINRTLLEELHPRILSRVASTSVHPPLLCRARSSCIGLLAVQLPRCWRPVVSLQPHPVVRRECDSISL